MPSATGWGRTGGLAVAVGACLALSCPAVAAADSPDSSSSSHSVGHAKPKSSVASPARNRLPGKSLSAARPQPAIAARTPNPVESVVSAVLGALTFARREFEHTLFNKVPTIGYDPTKNSLTAGNAITGNVGATDPENDPLAYKIKQQPTSGTVTIDTHGTFVYTPDAPMQPGDTAQFVVAVIDRGMGLHGIRSLLSPQTAGTTTATITIAVIAVVGAAPPQLSISDATATEPGPPVGAGYWHTSGNQILDAAGNPVQIAGVNWFGFEGYNGVPDGLWTRNYKDMMDQILDEGFNTIRLPFSDDVLHGQTPNSIDYAANPDLQGLASLQVMDKIVDYAGEIGLKIILDHHRNESGVSTTENGLWYNDKYSETDWVNDWVTLTARYADDPTVIGVDLHNEPYNGTWGGGGADDWARAAERAGNAVLAVNPNLLIMIEGIGVYDGQYYWYGGNLMGVKDRPIVLNVPNRVVYSPHDYPNSFYPQPWFAGANFGAGLPEVFKKNWGYIYEDNIAPVYLGEFGAGLSDPKDVVWYEAITSYLSGDFDNNGSIDTPSGTIGMSWTYWAWNANSVVTDGILSQDWTTVDSTKMVYLKPIQFDFSDRTGTSVATFTVTLKAASDQTITVHYATSGGTATEGSDFVGAAGTLTFLPGETSKTVAVTVLGDSAAEKTETFTVSLSGPVNATLAEATGVGTIVDHTTV
ncbi:cellulase family glycosylhydrolase [Mycolicibacterium psychrotolerans]|uniref:cellulase family glycosylhydrolase n=1 Tax=Mycolicibacterium psychrotolerans TaxID=216929 RepID=UPI003D665929